VRQGPGRFLTSLIFCLIVLGALDPRPTRRGVLQSVPDQRTPEYPLFLEEVARRTAPGDTIAVLVPMKDWAHGQAYAFYRASYYLAGRRVIPLMDVANRWHPERLRDARFLAAWKIPPPRGPYDIVWAGHDGVLMRRRP
jgi:hypothetical protein